MKIMALHLPAFHRIPENDAWWGDGFTEWDNVRKGRPLFPGHVQPRTPLHGYYDLSSPQAVLKQAEYAQSKGIDGFIFYHYWFQGHQLFEKPVEEFLREQKPEGFTYCLNWANETWARTWEGNEKDVLIRQEYGDRRDWLDHISYLAEFFRDPHSLKKDGRPVLFLYSGMQVPCLRKMVDVWNAYLEKIGLAHIYLIEALRPKNPDPTPEADGVFEFEPMYSIRYDVGTLALARRYLCKRLHLIDFEDYDKIWQRILKRKKSYGGLPVFSSAFVSWDNSPRKGKRGSIIVKNASPEKFGTDLYRLMRETRPGGANDLLIINSWNEWGEGANLEPSEEFGEAYLNALLSAKKRYLKECSGAVKF